MKRAVPQTALMHEFDQRYVCPAAAWGMHRSAMPGAVHNHRDNVRTRKDLRSAVEELIEAAARGPFLDGRRVRRLWRNFLGRREILWHKVDRIASLEANLQAHGI